MNGRVNAGLDKVGTQHSLLTAAADFRYLLSRGYPRLGALTYVGNHYQLPRETREVLNRGVYPEPVARVRRARLLGPERITGRAAGLDGHNVLITLENALSGQTLVACDDGAIRDTAGASLSYRPGSLTGQAIELVLGYLLERGVRSVLFLLDAPMSYSGELAAQIGGELSGREIMGRARAVGSPEAELRTFSGLVASSDSVVIDMVAEPIDLAGLIIREKFPDLPLIRLRTDED